MNQRTGYFKPSVPGHQVDPWEKSKLDSLEAALPSFLEVTEDHPLPSLDHLVLCCLWGNRSDLSLSSGAVDAAVAAGKASGILLKNDLAAVERYLSKNPASQVIMILDNCGAELLADLRLAAFLAQKRRVSLHVKAHPVFVSDATVHNVEQHIRRLEEAKCTLASTVRKLMTANQLTVMDDPFYCSPCEFPEAPGHLKRLYDEAGLLILKGDANYRRLVLDRHLPVDYPFDTLCKATTSTPIFAIRTCKSPVAVGLDKAIVQEVAAKDAKWCVNGTCGTLQFSQA
jgi:uncharacterized protein with ATP-grasp and redox domains